MDVVIFNKYNNIGDALVTFSALESGGFHPVFHTYHQSHLNGLEMLALGGIIVSMPSNEVSDAHRWLENIQTSPLVGDHIEHQKFGRWKTALFTGTVVFGIPLFLPILIPIWLHAKYIDVPKLEKRETHVH